MSLGVRGSLRCVEREERRVDIEERLLLPLGEAGVREDRQLHGERGGAADPFFGAEDPGADVELLRGDPQRLGDLLQYLGRGPAQTAFDLAQVGVGHAGLLGELPEGQTRGDTLLLQVVAERLDGLAYLALGHAPIVLTTVSKTQTQQA